MCLNSSGTSSGDHSTHVGTLVANHDCRYARTTSDYVVLLLATAPKAKHELTPAMLVGFACDSIRTARFPSSSSSILSPRSTILAFNFRSWGDSQCLTERMVITLPTLIFSSFSLILPWAKPHCSPMCYFQALRPSPPSPLPPSLPVCASPCGR